MCSRSSLATIGQDDDHEEASDGSNDGARSGRANDSRKSYTVRGGGGLRLHVREWGKPDGPPILFIHGWSQNHLCWAKQYESSLTDEFRLVAYDLRGHGMSEAPPEPEHYTADELWADDLAAIMNELRLDRPVLVAGRTARSSSATTSARTARTKLPRSISSRAPPGSARLPSAP